MQHNRPFQRLVPHRGVWLLLLYVLTVAPLAPAFAALLATCDPNHSVAVQQGNDGIQVVLQHRCVDLGGRHHHGFAAQVITLFAQQGPGTESNHILQFTSPDTAMAKAALAAEPKSTEAADDGCDLAVLRVAELRPLAFVSARPRLRHPADGFLVCLRSTVLVI